MDPKRIQLLVIGVVAVAALGLGLALYLDHQKTSQQERWDILGKLRKDGEPVSDPLWQAPSKAENPEREAYIRRLESFLDKTAKESDDALEPQTRYVIAKTLADHILANPGILDQQERGKFYAQAVEHLEAIREKFPDFPLNWSMLSPEGYHSLTRQFIQWLQDNQAWEKKHMLRAVEPAADVRVVIRTDRGDLLLGLFTEQAPAWTARFLERAIAGHYDDTCFLSKRKIGDVSAPEDHTVRAGGTMSRGMQAFDRDGHLKVTETKLRCGLLPEEARNLIPHERGVMSVWHDQTVEYDHEEQFILCAARSPLLDYKFTPVGKLLDTDGFKSSETLGRIFEGAVWNDEKEVRDNADLRPLQDLFQAPPKIVKILVFDKGTLQEPGEGGSPTKAEVADKERALSSIEVDRYKTDAPKPPEKKDAAAKKDGEDAPEKGAGAKDEPAKDDK